MNQTEVVISRGASGDISKLAAGRDRATVALSALKEENLTPAQVGALLALAKKYEDGTRTLAPSTAVTADTILQGFKKLSDGVIKLTLPVGVTIQKAGEILNRAAKNKEMEFSVFYEGQKDFWQKNEANEDLRTKPGKTYLFKIPTDSVSKTKSEELRDHGEGAPLGALAIAEACERLNTTNEGTLFKGVSGDRVWVRGSAPGVALFSYSRSGVFVNGSGDDGRDGRVAFASSVSARN